MFDDETVDYLKVEVIDGVTHYTEHIHPDEGQSYIDTLVNGDKRLKWKRSGSLGDADEMVINEDGTISMTTHSAPWLRKVWVYVSIYHPMED